MLYSFLRHNIDYGGVYDGFYTFMEFQHALKHLKDGINSMATGKGHAIYHTLESAGHHRLEFFDKLGNGDNIKWKFVFDRNWNLTNAYTDMRGNTGIKKSRMINAAPDKSGSSYGTSGGISNPGAKNNGEAFETNEGLDSRGIIKERNKAIKNLKMDIQLSNLDVKTMDMSDFPFINEFHRKHFEEVRESMRSYTPEELSPETMRRKAMLLREKAQAKSMRSERKSARQA